MAGPHQLKVHMRYKHGASNKTYKCHICSKIFNFRSNLNDHLKTEHTQESKMKMENINLLTSESETDVSVKNFAKWEAPESTAKEKKLELS
jgi:hypothetical protein